MAREVPEDGAMQLGSHGFVASVLVGGALLLACSSGASTPGDLTPSEGGTGTSSSGSNYDGGGLPYDGGGLPYDSGNGGSSSSGSGQADAALPSDGAGPSVDAGQGSPGDAAAGGYGPYGNDGPDTVTTAAFQITSSNDTFTTTAYIPDGTGPFPVVILSSGFEQTGIAYAPYANRLASWGIVTFLRDDPGVLSSLTVTQLAGDVGTMVTTWLATTNADSTSALHGKIDTNKIGLAGHSRGGQTALLAGESLQGKILGVFGIDPVDTSTANVEARTNLGTIGVPLAFIGETTDSASSGCAPAADNFMVLYGAASSPAVAITAVNADHTMFEDPAHCSFCTLCAAGKASQPLVESTAVRYLTAFFARQLLGDASVGAAFGGAGASQDVAAGVTQIVSK